jgi:hypothetical protein
MRCGPVESKYPSKAEAFAGRLGSVELSHALSIAAGSAINFGASDKVFSKI